MVGNAWRRRAMRRSIPGEGEAGFAALCRGLFWGMVFVGKPFGGIRPRRWTHWLARIGFRDMGLSRRGYGWHRDRRGCWFLLCPQFLIDRDVIAFGDYDRHLHGMIDRLVKPGMTCFDIGANIGTVSVHLALNVAPSGRVFAFEPIPELARRLRAHVRANRLGSLVRVERLALGDRSGAADMVLAEAWAVNHGTATLVGDGRTYAVESRVVEIEPIDHFVSERRIEHIDLMKIDIQGAEPLLLAGGPRTFGDVGPDLLMEVAPEELHGLGCTSRDLLSAVEAYGYSVFEIGTHGLDGRITARDVADDFAASNVYCTKQGIHE
jgi:FkbM family methyltransferase